MRFVGEALISNESSEQELKIYGRETFIFALANLNDPESMASINTLHKLII